VYDIELTVPSGFLYENGNFDPAITLLTLYTQNFEAYLSKRDCTPVSTDIT